MHISVSMTAALLILMVTPCTARAQKVCVDVNTSLQFNRASGSSQPRWFISEYTVTQNLINVSGLELALHVTGGTTGATLGIFASTAGGQPGALLSMGRAEAAAGFRLYSAALSPAVSVSTGSKIFVGVMTDTNTSVANDISGTLGTVGRVWLGMPGSWFRTSVETIAFRIYCGSNTGTTASYGQASAGAGQTPRLIPVGFPNLGNPLAFAVADIGFFTNYVLLVGSRTTQTLPQLGTLLVGPIAATLVGRTNNGAAGRIELQVPNSPSLTGGAVAWQVWFTDPTTVSRVGHTAGVETVIGN